MPGGLTDTGGLNYPSWSIAAEAFAYLLFPVLAIGIIKVRPVRAFLASVVFAMLFIAVIEATWPASLRPQTGIAFTRMENDFGALRILPEFLLGMALIWLIGPRTAPRIGRALTIVSLTVTGLAVALAQDLLFLAAIPALLAGLLLWRPGLPSALLWLGRMSYCLYMVHALVQIVGFKLIEQITGAPDGAAPFWSLPLLIIISLCAAAALHHWVERPARRALLRQPVSEPATGPQHSVPSDTARPVPVQH